MKRNPPCYRCPSSVPLEGERVGLCRKCELEVRAEREAAPVTPRCSECGYDFLTDGEWVQHVVVKRHNYRAWTKEDGKSMAETFVKRMAA